MKPAEARSRPNREKIARLRRELQQEEQALAVDIEFESAEVKPRAEKKRMREQELQSDQIAI